MTEQEALARMVAPGTRRPGMAVIDSTNRRNKWGKRVVVCQCRCGAVREVEPRHLKSGAVKTCGGKGCKVTKKHGGHGTALYSVWSGIKSRCLNTNDKDYSRYGGRGIDMDPRWLDFPSFVSDVGPPPAGEMSIDRKDNSRGYWPDNVRWATAKQQSNNRRSNVIIEHDGRRMTMAQWAQEAGIGVTTIHHRLRSGWSVERALLPSDGRRRRD